MEVERGTVTGAEERTEGHLESNGDTLAENDIWAENDIEALG